MTDKLTLYNAALRLCSEKKLDTLADRREARLIVDEVYDECVRYALEQGQWNFAIRAIEATAEPSIEPAFGMQHAFEKPADWLRTIGASADAYGNTPLQYEDEGEYWYSDSDPLYFRFVSIDPSYGLDLGRWPSTFARAVEAHIAAEICPRLSQKSGLHKELRVLEVRRFGEARIKDAVNQSAGRMRTGSWVRSRTGYGSRFSGTGRGL